MKKIKPGKKLAQELNKDDICILKNSEIANIINSEMEKLESSLIKSLMKKSQNNLNLYRR